MREPERRRQIIEGHAHLTSGPDAFAGYAFFGRFDDMYVLDDPVDYNLDRSRSLAADGPTGRHRTPPSTPTTCSCSRDGDQLIYTPLFNFVHGNLDAVREMITSPVAMFGLSDAGAHCGQICDGSMTTTYLSLWARDRREDGLPVEAVVHQISERPAAHFGWLDRGVVAPGYLADLNVIDLEGLGCAPPEITADLPAGRSTPPSGGHRLPLDGEDGEGDLRGRAPTPASCPARWCAGADPARRRRTVDVARRPRHHPRSSR